MTVVDDGNSQCYIFGAILDTMRQDVPNDGKYLTNFMRKKIQAYWTNDLSIETKTKYFKKTTLKSLKESIIMNDAKKESMNLSSMESEEEEDAIKYYYKIFLSIRKTISALDKNINELYIKDTEYVTETPKKDSITRAKSRKTKLMITDKYLYTRLFAMKHNIPIVFVQCQYDGKRGIISGKPMETMYSLYIFDENGEVINISQPNTSLPDNLL